MGTLVIDPVKTLGATRSLPSAKPPSEAVIDALAPEDQVLLARLLTEPAEYVDDAGFSDRLMERELWSAESRLVHRLATRFVEPPDPITDAVAAGERLPALTYAQEAHLFRRYNYARMQVMDILGKFAGKRLNPSATRRLLAWGHRALVARSVIVRINLPLVLAMAKRTRLSNVDFSEMVSEGNMALLRSVEKFDCSRGYKFSTYSCRAILKAFSRVAMRASRYRGHFPTEFDPAMERSDHLDRRRLGIEEDCVDELKQILLDNLAGLSEVERTVIRERFALERRAGDDTCSPKTLEQVGQIIGVTKERVRQIQNNALKKIRAALENTYLAA